MHDTNMFELILRRVLTIQASSFEMQTRELRIIDVDWVPWGQIGQFHAISWLLQGPVGSEIPVHG